MLFVSAIIAWIYLWIAACWHQTSINIGKKSHLTNHLYLKVWICIIISDYSVNDFPDDASGKEPNCECKRQEMQFDPWVRKIPWRRKRLPTPVSCLENTMDRGAWRAIVHRVTKSWTQLKCLKHANQEYITQRQEKSKCYSWSFTKLTQTYLFNE